MARRPFTFLACSAAAALAVSAPARADDAALAPVIVPAPPPAPGEAERAPAAATTVIDVAAEAGEGRSTAELVARVPGAVIRSYGGPGQLSTLSLRGASAEQCLVLLDGVPLTGATYGSVNLGTLSSALLERIEVIRGALGPIYGPGALGGVVNLVTRAPRPGPPTVDAEIRGGSFGTGELRLAGTSQAGPGAALVALDALGTRGNFAYQPAGTTAEATRTNNDARQLSGLGRYAVDLGSQRLLDLQLQAEGGERGLAGTIQNPTSADRMLDSRFTASARLTQKLEVGAVDLRVYGRQDRIQLTQPGQEQPAQRDTLLGAEARLQARAGHHGFNLLLHGAGEQLAQAGATRGRPELAAAATDEWLLLDGAVSLLPALRVDLVDHFSGVSPQLAIIVRPAPFLELRASAGQAWRAPSFSELYLDQGFVASNPSLRPERNYAADLGATLETGPWRASISVFGSEYADLIEYELYPPFRAKPFNVGTAGMAGGEAELSVKPRKELELSASYAYQQSRDLYDDVRFYDHELPYHPHHRGFFRAAWTGGRLTGHAELQAQSAQYLNRANDAALPGFFELGAGAAARPLASQPIWIGLEVQNLLNARREDLYGYPLPGRAVFASLRIASLESQHP